MLGIQGLNVTEFLHVNLAVGLAKQSPTRPSLLLNQSAVSSTLQPLQREVACLRTCVGPRLAKKGVCTGRFAEHKDTSLEGSNLKKER